MASSGQSSSAAFLLCSSRHWIAMPPRCRLSASENLIWGLCLFISFLIARLLRYLGGIKPSSMTVRCGGELLVSCRVGSESGLVGAVGTLSEVGVLASAAEAVSSSTLGWWLSELV